MNEAKQNSKIIWWIFLIVALGLIAAMQSRPVQRWLSDGEESIVDAAVGQVEYDVAARLMVGLNALSADQPTLFDDSHKAKMLGDIEKTIDDASSGQDQLTINTGIVIGELDGPQAAVDYLQDYVNEKRASGMIDLKGYDLKAELFINYYERLLSENTGQAALIDQLKDEGYTVNWYDKLAASCGLAQDDPLREEVISSAVWSVIALGVAVIVGGGAILLGFILLIVGIALYATGVIKFKHVSCEEPRTVYLGAMTLFLWLMLMLGIGIKLVAMAIPEQVLEEHRLLIGTGLKMVAYLGMPMAVLWPMVGGVKWKVVCKEIGLHAGGSGFLGFLKEIGAGVVAYLAGLPLIVLSLFVTVLLTKTTGEKGGHPIVFELMQGDMWWIIFAFASAVIWAPLVEETFFRGLFFTHLRQKHGFWLSALVVAFVFAAIHPQSLVGLPPIMALSIVFTVMREWRGSLIGPMVAHGLHNGTLTLFMLLLFT